jgi:uncharacterized protein YbjT (DUF2867 family)
MTISTIITGASGMVGEGVLLECLADPRVDRVLAITRKPSGVTHPKLREVIHADFDDLTPIQSQLAGYDACFFCLGVSSVGMSEAEYTRVTRDLTLNFGRTLARLNPDMAFCYVTGKSTDSTAHGKVMWARVKGATENALLRLPFKAAYMFRPAGIQPMHGETSKTKLYRVAYAITRPLLPLLLRLFPNYVTTTEILDVARNGAPSPILEPSAFRIPQ